MVPHYASDVIYGYITRLCLLTQSMYLALEQSLDLVNLQEKQLNDSYVLCNSSHYEIIHQHDRRFDP